MTKRDEAVFIEAFDELETEGFFDELREKARARELQRKVRAGAKPTLHDGVSSTTVVRGTFAEPLKADKKSGKKVPASVSSRNVVEKVPLAASKK